VWTTVGDVWLVGGRKSADPPAYQRRPTRSQLIRAAFLLTGVGLAAAAVLLLAKPPEHYPWHTNIVSTTFWVGEVFDPNASDGSQVLSTYDSLWIQSYGGCDGVLVAGVCQTEPRTASNGFFPSKMTPKENPFYLDLPFDDVNDATAFTTRQNVIPWSGNPEYSGAAGNHQISLMKNRWVRIRANGQTCYGQIQDAGPGAYHDAGYVFGSNDQRPTNQKYNGAGMDVSPALNGCLRFTDINGEDDKVDWQFVDYANVPTGPWKSVVTISGLR
jgi:hypothetical protein